MAYQNVGTPRFYVNHIEWLDTAGKGIYKYVEIFDEYGVGTGEWEYIRLDASIFYTIPKSEFLTYPHNYNVSFSNFYEDEDNPALIPYLIGDNQFFAILGHNLADNLFSVSSDGAAGQISSTYNGFSLFSTDGKIINATQVVGTFIVGTSKIGNLFGLSIPSPIGSVVMGSYYDMPNAPNLSLSVNREYGGTKEFTTYNGSSMSNTMWNKPPKWGDLGAWELGDSSPSLAKSGRRTWDLKFSYMDDGDLWGSNQMLSTGVGNTLSESAIALYDGTIPSGDLYSDTTFQHTLLSDDNFFSQVWHKTLGGTLPFIFQPDSSNNNPDQFAICKFKNNSLKATQSAFNVYDISLSVEEVW